MAGGRPTKYKKEFCDVVIEHMEQGASKIEVCAEIGICYQTFLDWQEAQPEFCESVKIGDQLSEAWWMREGRKNLKDREFNYTGWYMNMKNRHGWKDKHENTHSGPDGKPIETDNKWIVEVVHTTKDKDA